MAGSALSPIKFVRKYRFENYWLIYGLTGTVVIPWALALSATPHLFSVYFPAAVESVAIATGICI